MVATALFAEHWNVEAMRRAFGKPAHRPPSEASGPSERPSTLPIRPVPYPSRRRRARSVSLVRRLVRRVLWFALLTFGAWIVVQLKA
ncbi:hypothetical protein [Acuticoccus sp.]|uniref:hypothetical protein n=1 Tax=Acuticoccus sp. TaxID=1904378 RepID=UPI003B51FE29